MSLRHPPVWNQRRPYTLLDTFRDIRRYSRASILQIANRRREHRNRSCFPRTRISIGPNHGVPRSAEARARAVVAHVSQYITTIRTTI